MGERVSAESMTWFESILTYVLILSSKKVPSSYNAEISHNALQQPLLLVPSLPPNPDDIIWIILLTLREPPAELHLTLNSCFHMLNSTFHVSQINVVSLKTKLFIIYCILRPLQNLDR